VTQRDTWQALQAHLAAARRFVDGADPRGALAEVDAALALDPDFLAAQSLRARILKQWPATLSAAKTPASPIPASLPVPPTSAIPPVKAPVVPQASSAAALLSTPPIVSGAPVGSAAPVGLSFDDVALAVEPVPLAADPVLPSAPPAGLVDLNAPRASSGPPLVSVEGYARFEARARRRRVDRRIEAARAAMERRKLHEAASVLDEIITLDPNLPELAQLTAEFDELRKAVATPHRGPWLLAAAVFIVFVLGASWVHESNLLVSYPVKTDLALVVPPLPSLITEPVQDAPPVIATAGVREVENAIDEREIALPQREIALPSRPRRENSSAVSAVLRTPAAVETPRAATAVPPLPTPALTIPVVNESAPVSATVTPAPPPSTAPPAAPPPAPRPNPPVAMASAPAAASVVPAVDDENLVKSALQRYRRAYERLDARSAQAVWPAVNQAALARAFDGLASQTITFDNCDVQVRGSAASATCRGSARYVPKVGSREPRVESRVWNFALKKDAGEWKIDSARAER
jgi:hypothetical protein